MPQVPGPVRRERAARLRAAGAACARPVLRRPRRHDDGGAGGKARTSVAAPGTRRFLSALRRGAEPGTLVPVRINAADDERLYAEMAS